MALRSRVYKRLSGAAVARVQDHATETRHNKVFSVDMDCDEETLLLALLLRRRRRRRRKQRSLWMHPIPIDRLTSGQFYTIMSEFKKDSSKIFNYFRITAESFKQLLAFLKIHIERADTNMRKSIPAEERLAITLRYLATGCSFTDLHYIFRCGIYTARQIVIEVCVNIWQHLHEVCFPQLTENEWLIIANGFEARANFPNWGP
ncbi:hypothetical protein PR048_021633 [Dryococelus australis]|uniref:Transposase n=1 Tax=Dryococelus australis TaxID=614101 RepID=A0ABQ9GYT4_9NEOP|nr:hypothetical protein PR048_021633 [Dryococelus australis]